MAKFIISFWTIGYKSLKLERIGTDWPHLAQQAAEREQRFADFPEQLLAGLKTRS